MNGCIRKSMEMGICVLVTACGGKMTARYFKYDYFRRFLFHKVNQNYSLDDIFDTMELGDLLEGFLRIQKSRVPIRKRVCWMKMHFSM